MAKPWGVSSREVGMAKPWGVLTSDGGQWTSKKEGTMKYQLNFSDEFPKRMFIVMSVIQLFLVFTYIFLSMIINRPSHTFNLDSEANIPAWYSTIQLFLIAVVLLADNLRYDSMSKKARLFVKLAGLGFVFFSMDEAGQVHETISNILKASNFKLLKGNSGLWAACYAIIGAGLIFWGRKAIAELYKGFNKELKIAFAGFFLMVIGSAVLEKLGYMYIPRDGLHEVLYKVEVVFEEYFEMLGESLIFLGASRALLRCRKLMSENKNEIKETITYFAPGRAD